MGEELTVETTVANNGTAGGTYEAQLTADGEVLGTQSVYIPAGGGRVLTFTHSFEVGGEYSLSINEEHLGNLTVRAQVPPADETATSTPTTSSKPDDGGRLLELLGGLAVLVVLFLLFALWRRRDEEEEDDETDGDDEREDQEESDTTG